MVKEIDYTLTEIMEGPKRLNNINHAAAIDYMLEACESQGKFELFVENLRRFSQWAYLGFVFMASDLVPVSRIFEKELDTKITPNSRIGSVSEFQLFTSIMSSFHKQLFFREKERAKFFKYAIETLSDEQYDFFMACMRQKYQKELFPMFKKMYENGAMNRQIYEFFSFATDRSKDNVPVFTNNFYVVGSYKVYKMIGNIIFDGDTMLPIRECDRLISFFSNKIMKNSATTRQLYVRTDTNEPFMIVSADGYIMLQNPEKGTSSKLADIICRKPEMIIFCSSDDKNEIVTVFSVENGGMVSKKESITEPMITKIPIIGDEGIITICTSFGYGSLICMSDQSEKLDTKNKTIKLFDVEYVECNGYKFMTSIEPNKDMNESKPIETAPVQTESKPRGRRASHE